MSPSVYNAPGFAPSMLRAKAEPLGLLWKHSARPRQDNELILHLPIGGYRRRRHLSASAKRFRRCRSLRPAAFAAVSILLNRSRSGLILAPSASRSWRRLWTRP